MLQQTTAGILSARAFSTEKVLYSTCEEAVVCRIEWNNRVSLDKWREKTKMKEEQRSELSLLAIVWADAVDCNIPTMT